MKKGMRVRVKEKCFGLPISDEIIECPNGYLNLDGPRSAYLDRVCGADAYILFNISSRPYAFKGSPDDLLEEGEAQGVEVYGSFEEVYVPPENSYRKLYDLDKLEDWIASSNLTVLPGEYRLTKGKQHPLVTVDLDGRPVQLLTFKSTHVRYVPGSDQTLDSRRLGFIYPVHPDLVGDDKLPASRRTRQDIPAVLIERYLDQCERMQTQPNHADGWKFLEASPEIADYKTGTKIFWLTQKGDEKILTRDKFSDRFNRALKKRM